jgi:hypothetical protein
MTLQKKGTHGFYKKDKKIKTWLNAPQYWLNAPQ